MAGGPLSPCTTPILTVSALSCVGAMANAASTAAAQPSLRVIGFLLWCWLVLVVALSPASNGAKDRNAVFAAQQSHPCAEAFDVLSCFQSAGHLHAGIELDDGNRVGALGTEGGWRAADDGPSQERALACHGMALQRRLVTTGADLTRAGVERSAGTAA